MSTTKNAQANKTARRNVAAKNNGTTKAAARKAAIAAALVIPEWQTMKGKEQAAGIQRALSVPAPVRELAGSLATLYGSQHQTGSTINRTARIMADVARDCSGVERLDQVLTVLATIPALGRDCPAEATNGNEHRATIGQVYSDWLKLTKFSTAATRQIVTNAKADRSLVAAK